MILAMSSTPRAERYNVSFRVVWDDGESYYTGPVTNISETGIFVETAMPLPAGHAVTVIPLVDGVALFELRGKVIRHVGEDLDNAPDRVVGMGIRFDQVTPQQLAEMRKMVAKYRAT
jgi:hypothetical protein